MSASTVNKFRPDKCQALNVVLFGLAFLESTLTYVLQTLANSNQWHLGTLCISSLFPDQALCLSIRALLGFNSFMGLEAMNGDISLRGNCQVLLFKRLLVEEALFPWRGVGFPLLARELRGIYRFKVLSIIHVCPNVFKPCLMSSHSSPTSALNLGSEAQQF